MCSMHAQLQRKGFNMRLAMWTRAEVSMPKWLCYAIWNSSHSGCRRGETLITTPWWILYACVCVCVWSFHHSSTLVTSPQQCLGGWPCASHPAFAILFLTCFVKDLAWVSVRFGMADRSVHLLIPLSGSRPQPRHPRCTERDRKMYTLCPRTKYICDIKGLVHLGSTDALLSSTTTGFMKNRSRSTWLQTEMLLL